LFAERVGQNGWNCARWKKENMGQNEEKLRGTIGVFDGISQDAVERCYAGLPRYYMWGHS